MLTNGQGEFIGKLFCKLALLGFGFEFKSNFYVFNPAFNAFIPRAYPIEENPFITVQPVSGLDQSLSQLGRNIRFLSNETNEVKANIWPTVVIDRMSWI